MILKPLFCEERLAIVVNDQGTESCDKVPPPEQGQMDLQLMMEEANLAPGAPMDIALDRMDTERLVQLSLVVLNSDFSGSPEVGTIPFVESYFVILDMNGLLLEKRPSINGHDRVYSFREDVGEFLEFCMRNFEVVFWSCCNQRNLKAIF